MLNEKLIKNIKIAISICVVLIFSSMTYFVGNEIGKRTASKDITARIESSKNSGDSSIEEQLKNKTKDFLLVYFTKKDLGENRDRYRPYVTEGMYNSLVSEEEKPVNKAYQGYIVDWEFQGADTYIDSEKMEVLVNVRYKNSTLAMKDDKSTQATKDLKSSYKIVFTKVDNTLLINKMEQIRMYVVAEGEKNDN